jgi:hypothetical protein
MMSDEMWNIISNARARAAELIAARSFLPDLQILFMLDRAILMDPRTDGPSPVTYELEPELEPAATDTVALQRQVEQDSKIIDGLRKELAGLRKRLGSKK